MWELWPSLEELTNGVGQLYHPMDPTFKTLGTGQHLSDLPFLVVVLLKPKQEGVLDH